MVKNNKILIFVILALGFTVYSGVLSAPFKNYDDNFSIVHNQEIKDLNNVVSIFSSSFFGAGHYYRPLVTLSNMLEYHFFGLDAFYFHLMNIILHLLTSVIVFYLFLKMLKDRYLAFFISLLFAIHPINSEAVSNIPDRAVLLGTFFVTLSFYLFCLSQDKFRRTFQILSLASFSLALLSKESSAMLPVIILGYGLILADNKKNMFKIGLMKSLSYFIILILFVMLRKYLNVVEVFGWQTPKEHVLAVVSFLRAALTHMRLFVFPIDLYFDRGQRLFLRFANIELVMTLFVWVGVLSLYLVNKNRIPAIIKFLMFWAIIELIPVSQMVTAIGLAPGYISVAEHFLYGPSVPVLAILVLSVNTVLNNGLIANVLSKPSVMIVIVGMITFIFIIGIKQSIYNSDPLIMLKRSVEYNPNNSRITTSLGLELAARGRIREADIYFREAIKTDPGLTAARIGHASALCDQGYYDVCLKEYRAINNAGRWQVLLLRNIELIENKIKEDTKKNE